MANRSGPKLTEEQRAVLLKWLAAEYAEGLVLKWAADGGFPLTSGTLSYYRQKWAEEIAAARAARRGGAMAEGLALKEERVRRLAEHADELEAIKWLPDEKGRLWNEKAWRETLDDIAKEMGHRRQGMDVALQQEIDGILDRLRDNLPREDYAKILALLGGGGAAAQG